MKNPNKYFGYFVLLALILSQLAINAQEKPKGSEWKVPEKEALKKSPVKFDEVVIKEGKDIWAKSCKSCHGSKGLGDGTKAESIDISCGDFSSRDVQDLTDGSLFWKITAGRKPMPSYKDPLTDNERWALVAFIRTLKSAGSTTSTTEKTTKVISSPDKDTKVVVTETTIINTKDGKTTIENTEQTDSLKMTSPEYLELKNEIELLKMEMKTISSRVDSLKTNK